MADNEDRSALAAVGAEDEEKLPRKRGTRPRGKRSAITVRVPDDQYEIYAQQAAAIGIPIGSWVAIQLAQTKHLDIPSYITAEITKAEERRKAEEAARAEELHMLRSA